MSRPLSVSPSTGAGPSTSSPATPTTARKRERADPWRNARRGEGSQSPPAPFDRERMSDNEPRSHGWEASRFDRRANEAPQPARSATGGQGWTYHLEVIQQPQRARACGFGNKDRRPLSPPPIIRLWIRTTSGEIVDPNLVDTRFFVLSVDLWSADRQQERNVVMHPVSAGVSRLDSPPLTHDQTAGPSSRPNTGTSRPVSGSSGGISTWSSGSHRHPAAYTPPIPPSGPMMPPESPSAHRVESAHQPSSVHPSPRSGWSQSRPPLPPFHRTQSYTRPEADQAPEPPRPKTAPSPGPHASPSPSPHLPEATPKAYTLPPLASIAEDRPTTSSGLTLPALNARAQSFRPSSSGSAVYGRPRTLQSLADDRGATAGDFSFGGRPISSSSSPYGSTEYGGRDRPSSGWSDARPWSGISNRPSSSGEELQSPRSSQFGYPVQVADPLYPPTPGTGPGGVTFSHPDPYSSSEWETEKVARYMTSQPTAQYSRVLVGKVNAVCHKLQDEDDQPGLYFFAADLCIRTEGTFCLKMAIFDLSSLMGPDVIMGRTASVLCETYSDPFTVYSAKRFPGVIPTTPLTKMFASQGVKLSVRETKKRGGRGGGDDDDDDDE